ncbi:hypothetical protein CLOSTMETH_03943 [[Clostridium] methylpentosum DSM 5476]|uniref:Uncharacterized protein n=1 Tax=[Clostridium] methylpentosum DSM 5476 TaxID=537013 RepID=C0EJ90_9FIRM|nr:hypothetical protein CLOSTMETH_03943 [[Clostridium] methylpentosum DSM 5476]
MKKAGIFREMPAFCDIILSFSLHFFVNQCNLRLVDICPRCCYDYCIVYIGGIYR